MKDGKHSHVMQEEFERAAALLAPAGDMFGDDDDMFAENTENADPQPAATSSPSGPRPSALATPRVSFSFPEIMADSSGGTPRLHSVSPTEDQGQQLQQGEPASKAAQQAQHVGNGTAAEHMEADQNGGAAQVSSGKPQPEEPEVDYHSWPIKELRRFLTERGLVSQSCPKHAHGCIHNDQPRVKSCYSTGTVIVDCISAIIFDHTSANIPDIAGVRNTAGIMYMYSAYQ